MTAINKCFIAAAGSGKTTYLVETANALSPAKVLVVTFTIENAENIREKFRSKAGRIPQHVAVETWFTFLLRHFIRPFQTAFDNSLADFNVKGLAWADGQSGIKTSSRSSPFGRPIFYAESDLLHHYFSKGQKIYTDKISKFAVGGSDARKRKRNSQVPVERFESLVINRLSRIYSHILIDEVQDLAGYDLEVLKLLLASSIHITMVGDPRQVTYLTHWEKKHQQYRCGRFAEFIRSECKEAFDEDAIDYFTLRESHRCGELICSFASRLFPELPPTQACNCDGCVRRRSSQNPGVFAVTRNNAIDFLGRCPDSAQLGLNKNSPFLPSHRSFTFGQSKGREFDTVLIHPTKDYIKWLDDNRFALAPLSRCKLYVGITRARSRVGFVLDEIRDGNGLVRFVP